MVFSRDEMMGPTGNPRVMVLQAEVARLEAELGPDCDADAIVQRHIRLLHTYNEIKDGTQALIGKYANLTNMTVTAVHQELDLSLVEDLSVRDDELAVVLV